MFMLGLSGNHPSVLAWVLGLVGSTVKAATGPSTFRVQKLGSLSLGTKAFLIGVTVLFCHNKTSSNTFLHSPLQSASHSKTAFN